MTMNEPRRESVSDFEVKRADELRVGDAIVGLGTIAAIKAPPDRYVTVLFRAGTRIDQAASAATGAKVRRPVEIDYDPEAPVGVLPGSGDRARKQAEERTRGA